MAGLVNVFEKFRLAGEVAFITGAGSGIGRVAALTLAEAGARVAVTDIDLAKAEAVAAEIAAAGGRAEASQLDVASENGIGAAIGRIADSLGRLDVLVNNVGISAIAPSETFRSEDWRRVIDVNLSGTFFACREAGRRMLAAGSGRIINVASVMGLSGGGLYPTPAYAASKGAIVNLTRELAAEWAGRGVRVNAIAPGLVVTAMTAGMRANQALTEKILDRTPMKRFAEPEEMAGGILYLASAASSMVTGHILVIDGGILAI
ncbi:MAG TPA: SDR family oxidoreductase [Bauldia sp.]|nr:SDR family oxidoreductase [Bauldia sp.]